MGANLPFLIPFIALFLIFASPAHAVSRCLGCHQSHYADRGSCTSCHRGNDRTDRKRVAHDMLITGKYSWSKVPGSPPVERGKKLTETYACRRCHVIGKKGNRLAADLDSASSIRRPQELAESIRVPAQLMPDFKLNNDDISALVNAILAGTAASKGNEPPVVVHFSRAGRKEDVFGSKCGPCHRMLTSSKGGLGRGQIGPNLSGLLTEYYPTTFRHGSRWTIERLKEWVGNPRRVRPLTTMQPVLLGEDEWNGLRSIFSSQTTPQKALSTSPALHP